MYRLLLVNPSSKETVTGLGAYKSSSIAPLALAYLASLTPNTYAIEIIDENIERLTFKDVDIVGITSYTSQIHRAYKIAAEFRDRNIPVVMGGIHVSMMPEEALAYCTSVVMGEAEGVWPQLLQDFEKGRLKQIYSGEPFPLKDLPVPNRSLFKKESYLWGSIITSKGCPMDCAFCSVTRFNGRKFRRRPMESVINELKTIGNRFVWILDDNILGFDGKKWLTEFFNKIIELKLKKYFFVQASMNFGKDIKLVKLAHRAGVRMVLVGIESVDMESLKQYNKNLNIHYARKNQFLKNLQTIRRGGIAILGCFILGGDQDKIDSFKKTLDFIRQSRIDVLQLTKPTPLPGTKFYDAINNDGRIINTNYPEAWKDYKFTRMLYTPKHLTVEDVYQGFYYLRTIYHSLPAKLRRLFHTLKDTRSLTTTMVAAIYDHTHLKSWQKSELNLDYDMSQIRKKFERPD